MLSKLVSLSYTALSKKKKKRRGGGGATAPPQAIPSCFVAPFSDPYSPFEFFNF